MKVPEVQSLVQIEHNGSPVIAIVDDVTPDGKGAHWIILQVSGNDFRKGEQSAWIFPQGKIPAGIHEVYNFGNITKIRMWCSPGLEPAP